MMRPSASKKLVGMIDFELGGELLHRQHRRMLGDRQGAGERPSSWVRQK